MRFVFGASTSISTALLRCVTTKNIFKTIFNQGEDTEDWANDEPVEMEVEAPNTNRKSELLPQETGQIVNSSESREVRKFEE